MLIFILKSSACLTILFLFYKLVLEKENMHVFKRYYLLGSLILSLVIPWITFTSYIEYSPIILSSSDIILQPELVTKELQSNLLPIILWSLYSLGVLFFGIKFYYNISNIIYKINNNSKQKIDKFTNVLLLDLIIPHTFFNYIFLNKQKFETHQIPREVLLHEQTHAKQKHSVDILFIEAVQVVFWFNPLIYFIKNSIKLNHEFLADKEVLNHGVPLINYQQILLAFLSNSMQPALANAINYSLIKKRFTVMKTHTSKKAIWLRNIILLPLLAILIYSFSDNVIVEKERSIQNSTQENLQNINEFQLSQVAKEINIKINKKEQILLNDEKIVTLGTLANEIKKIITNYRSNQLVKVKAVIEIQGDIKTGLITDIKIELRKTGINLLNIRFNGSERNLYLNQDKATPEQIAEYNGIIKALMGQPENKRIIKQKDVKRIEHIYNLMTEVQKKKAEPFPKLVPPPPPPTLEEKTIKKGSKTLQTAWTKFSNEAELYAKAVGNYRETKKNFKELDTQYKKVLELHAEYSKLARKENLLPPPPPPRRIYKDQKLDDVPSPSPLSNDAGFYQKMKDNEVLKKNKDKNAAKTYSFMTEVEEIIEGVEIPEVMEVEEVPLSSYTVIPLSSTGHIIKMAKKGAIFYYEGKKISSDKAIEITKNIKNIYTHVREYNSKKPIVKLSTKPIIIEAEKPSSEKTKNESGSILINGEKHTYINRYLVTHYYDKDGNEVNKNGNPLPEQPSSPIDHVINMAKKDADFYYSGMNISSDKAIQLVKSNKKLRVYTKNADSDHPTVNINLRPMVRI